MSGETARQTFDGLKERYWAATVSLCESLCCLATCRLIGPYWITFAQRMPTGIAPSRSWGITSITSLTRTCLSE